MENILTKSKLPLSIASLLIKEKGTEELNKPYCNDKQLDSCIKRLEFSGDYKKSKKKLLKKQIDALDSNSLSKLTYYLNIANIAFNCKSEYSENTVKSMADFIINCNRFEYFYSDKIDTPPPRWIGQIIALVLANDLLTDDGIKNSKKYLTDENISDEVGEVRHITITDRDGIINKLGKISDKGYLKAFELLNNNKIQATDITKVMPHGREQHHHDVENKHFGHSKDSSLSNSLIGLNSSISILNAEALDARDGFDSTNTEAYKEKRNVFLKNCTKLFRRCHFGFCCAKTDIRNSDEYLPTHSTATDSQSLLTTIRPPSLTFQ